LVRFSGIRLETLQLLLEMYNRGVVPRIPSQGSVGASGDLAPLAHLAQVLIGEGWARVEGKGKELRGRVALRKVGLEPITLEAKEGLSLINGVQVSSALLADALLRAWRLFDAADIIGAITLEALLGSVDPFDARIQAVRAHPGQIVVAERVRSLIAGSGILDSHRDCGRVQDAYSLRCIPQVHGAGRDALTFVESNLITELNASTDNPLVFPEEGEILSGGNFHGAPIGYAADLLAIVVADLASISERRIERLVNPDLSGLSPFLSRQEGLESGYMMAQVTAASLVSENKVLAHPASVDTVPTSAGTEDHVSMSTWAARKSREIVSNAERVLGIELLITLDALETRRPLKSGKALERAVAAARERLPRVAGDRSLSDEIETAARVVAEGTLAGAARI
jgi:histidine ammonia-lyase